MDCERLVPGILGQPTNALSSLVFVVAAGWIVLLALRGSREERAATIVFAMAVAVNGFGSFVYHGPQPSWGRWAHDVSIVAVLLFIVGHSWGPLRRWRTPPAIAAYLGVLALFGLGLALFRDASDPFAGALAAGAIGGHLMIRPRQPGRRRQEGWGLDRIAGRVALGAAALGVVAFLLGQTGSPWCAPDSWFQWHAVWHVLIAIALACYASATLSRGSRPAPRSDVA
jgi:predicted membrane channel-forming protein YqfA (hemolysin III family)